MGRASNTLKGSDVTTTPVRLKYSQSYSSNTMDNYGISVYNGINTPVDADGNFTQEFLNYASARQLYYKSYISGSILGSGSGYNDNLQSTAASGTFDNDFRIFPTASNSTIATLSIPMSAFGERMARGSFNITFNNYGYHLIDDGNGNIIDIDNSNEHVGNILYAQGMVVITNATYVPVFTPLYNDFNFYINNTVNVSGSITGSSELRISGYTKFMVEPGPARNVILPGFNEYVLDYALGTFPTDIKFASLQNSNTSGFGAPKVGVVIFDSVYPIGSGLDPIAESINYAWNTVDSATFDTQPIFLPTNIGAIPILEVALVPIVRQCVSVVFNHFDTTLNPSARITIQDNMGSSIFFDKTIADIVSDDTYAYLIQTPQYRGESLAVDISNVTRVDGSSSPIRIFSKIDNTGNPEEDIKYRSGLGSLSYSAFSYPINYASVNIQLEYAS
jgi:hypothetical protein